MKNEQPTVGTSEEVVREESPKQWFLFIVLVALCAALVGGIIGYTIGASRVVDGAQNASRGGMMRDTDSSAVPSYDDGVYDSIGDEDTLEDVEDDADTSTSPSDDISFPVVVYIRAGLWSDLAANASERAKLQEMLVEPMQLYYNETETNLVSLQITVPTRVGDAYEVTAVFANPSSVSQFVFGTREGEFGYWEPECMDECDFSPSFSERYPVIVGREE